MKKVFLVFGFLIGLLPNAYSQDIIDVHMKKIFAMVIMLDLFNLINMFVKQTRCGPPKLRGLLI